MRQSLASFVFVAVFAVEASNVIFTPAFAANAGPAGSPTARPAVGGGGASAAPGPPAGAANPGANGGTPGLGGGNPAPAPTPVAWPVFDFAIPGSTGSTPALVTMAVGNDVATNATAAALLAAELQRKFAPDPAQDGFLLFRDHNAHSLVSKSVVIPTTFSFADLEKQCENHTIEGAYVVLPGALYNASENYFLFTHTWTRASLATIAIACPEVWTVTTPAHVVWASTVKDGQSNHTDVSVLPFVFLASLYSVLVPSKTLTTAATRAYPTSAPLPAGGQQTQVQSTTSSVSNPSAAAAPANALIGLVAGSQAFAPMGATNAPVAQAIRGSVKSAVEQGLHDCWVRPEPPAEPVMCSW